MKRNKYTIPPFHKKSRDSYGQVSRLDDSLLLLQLRKRGRNCAPEQKLATGFDVVIHFGVEVIVRHPVEALVEMREATHALSDGVQTCIHHHLDIRNVNLWFRWCLNKRHICLLSN